MTVIEFWTMTFSDLRMKFKMCICMDEAHLDRLDNRKGKLPVFIDDDNNALVSDSEDDEFDAIRKIKESWL